MTARDALRVFDLHCDTLDALAMNDTGPYADLGIANGGTLGHSGLQLSGDRLAGMAWCQCLAIWVPDDLRGITAHQWYRKVAGWFLADVQSEPQNVTRVTDAAQIEASLAPGHLTGMLTVENGSPIGHDLGVIDEFARDGVRMVTLTWNGKNSIASGNVTTDGLSGFGREVVRSLEEHRIVVDVSHLNDHGFADLLGVATRPFVASHSNSRAVCDHPRNLTDDQFRAIRDMGGLVGINYFRQFITTRDAPADGEVTFDELSAHIEFITTRDAPADGEVTFDELSAHIEHFLNLGGERVLALGSDFDGSTVPTWLDGCQHVPAFHDRVAGRFGQKVADRMFFQNAHEFFLRQ